jgi:hypothetical protein
MPVDGVVYTTSLTLIIFLVFRIPGIWERVDFARSRPGENTPAGGAAAIVAGLLSLTIQFWMAPSHTISGVNYGAAFLLTTTGIGAGLLILGTALVLQAFIASLPVGRLAQDESKT